ncbi:TniQ family protein [Bacillus mycoides]|uniref:TniQ family protein n=1 Tax=Bacillus mycoides TaxID=1405 RepID=UPI00292EB80D|nr:TniQ family protein [Bacillus mycoides]WOA63260.1 TniQ family protein [Bacillus mycoides]
MNNIKIFEEKQATYSFSKRSEFYALEPIGIGTDRVEGLVSYLRRLANAHNVTLHALVSYIIKLHPNQLIHPTPMYYPILRNGMSKTMGLVVESLEELGLISNPKNMTMLPWENVMSYSKLFTSEKKWCPICLEEWKNNGIKCYEPLVWGINLLNICSQHNVKLHQFCSNVECRASQSSRHEKLPIEYCQICNQWLGINKNLELKFVNKDIEEWNVWVADNLGEMVIKISNLKIPKNNQVYGIIDKWIQDFFQGDRRRFCYEINIDNNRLQQIERGKYRLSLNSLLLLSYRTKLKLNDLFYYGIES